MSLWVYALLFLTALFAGFIDSIAGGGGIITIPALLAAGLPPHLALGTNKLQATFGSFSAGLRFFRTGFVRPGDWKIAILCTFLGAVLGTLAVQRISGDFLNVLIPVFLTVIFFYTLFSPHFSDEPKENRLKILPFSLLVGLSLGFYDGFFGPGTGSFWTMAYLILFGMGLRSAVAHTKIMNFTSNIASLLFFFLGGNVSVLPGLLMGLGQFLGAWVGSHVVIRKNVRYIRLLFLLVVGATIVRILVIH